MKRFIALAILFACFSVLQAQTTHNPVQGSEDVTLTTKVITPLIIENAQQMDGGGFDLPGDNHNIPDVIKGQKRDLTGNEGNMLLFHMVKEADYKVRFTLDIPLPVDNVSLDAAWHFSENPPSEGIYNWSDPLTQSFDWYGKQYECWIAFYVNAIDATHQDVTTGVKTFTATCSGRYINL